MQNNFPYFHEMSGTNQFGAPITRGFDLIFNHILDELISGVGLFEFGECGTFEISGGTNVVYNRIIFDGIFVFGDGIHCSNE